MNRRSYVGNSNPFFGKKHSEEVKIKMSLVKKNKSSGANNPFFGKTHSEEAKKRMSLAHKNKPSWNKGIPFSPETRMKMSLVRKGKTLGRKNPFFGKKHTLETRLKIRNAGIGRKQSELTKLKKSLSLKKAYQEGRHIKVSIVPWNKGKKLPPISQELREIISKRHTGKSVSLETRQRMRDALKGNKGANWIDGRTPLAKMIRRSLEFKEWRKAIFQRDNWTCQECFRKGGNLHPHHKREFSYILQKFIKNYSQLSPLDDKETLAKLAITYKHFWDIKNGVTLCKDCHKNKHKLLKKIKKAIPSHI